MEEHGLKLSITEGGKAGKSKVIASCRFLEERFQKYSEEEGSTPGDESGKTGCSFQYLSRSFPRVVFFCKTRFFPSKRKHHIALPSFQKDNLEVEEELSTKPHWLEQRVFGWRDGEKSK